MANHPNTINNLVFDLGGVLLNIDYQRTIVAFEDLGCRDFRDQFTQYAQIPLFDKLEAGAITGNEFLEGLNQLMPVPVDKSDLIRAWNAMLLDFPESNIEMLEAAGQHYRLFLLSNTNVIHLRAFNNMLKMQYEIDGLEHFFEKAYFSHQIGLRKPDPEAFRLILRDNDLKPEETLFFDDLEQNLEGARKVGMHTFHKTETISWSEVAERWGLNLGTVKP